MPGQGTRLSPRRATGLSGPRLSVQGVRLSPSDGHVYRMVEKRGCGLTVGDQRLVFEVGHVAAIHCGWHRSGGRWPRLSALAKNAQ
jgi:hypothetical protein